MSSLFVKFKERILQKEHSIEPLIASIEEIRNRSTILTICAVPTGYAWLGAVSYTHLDVYKRQHT